MSEHKEDTKPEVKPKKQTVEEMETEMKALELESKRLEVEEKKANVQDLRERLDERELGREKKRNQSLNNGATLKQIAHNEHAAQERCNHRKGGNGAEGVMMGRGDDSQYAVLKHQFQNGDLWIRCLRCGKTWKPPIKSAFKTSEQYEAAVVLYREAVNFQTRNVTSGSVAFQYSDGGQYFRESMAATTLR